MVGIVVVSHSRKLAEELINFTNVFKIENFDIKNGTDDKLSFGTSKAYVEKAIREADMGEGVLIFADLGTSIDISVALKKELKDEIKIEIANAPIFEGLLSAVVANDDDIDLEELKLIAEDSSNFRKVK